MLTPNLIHNSEQFHRDAGTFFSSFYSDADRIFYLLDSYSWTAQNILQTSVDAASLHYRKHIPVLREIPFYPFTFHENKNLYQNEAFYGDVDLTYGKVGLKYDIPQTLGEFIFSIPEGIVDIDLICDTPVDPTIILFKDRDFVIKEHSIEFKRDPFEIFSDTQNIEGERVLTLFFRTAYVDEKYVQERLNFLTKTKGVSTQANKDFCNILLDSYEEGTTVARLNQIVCAVFDVPCAKKGEKVVSVDENFEFRFLITETELYKAPKQSRWLVEEGDTLERGQILNDAAIPVFGRDIEEDLFLERRFLGKGFLSGLLFPNREEKVQQDDLYTKAWFSVEGREEDIDLFWSLFLSRVNQQDILKTESFGGWINPARFIYRNLLYPRIRFYEVDLNKCGTLLPMENTQIFRQLIPPGVLFSLRVKAYPLEETLDFGIRGDGRQNIAYERARASFTFETSASMKLC
jgi:hypothetical protein